MHQPLRRSLPALAALGIAIGAPLLTAGTAHAQGEYACGDVNVKYSVDGGKSWTEDGRMDDQPHGVIQVKLVGDITEGCDYEVSLASYDTEGPTWETSGKQTFLGWATTTLNSGHRQATLDVSAHLPKCFGQIDLYNNDQKFDGVANKLPKYPDGVFPNDLITAWNGGKECAPTPTPTGTPTGTPTSSASPTGTATPHPTGTPTSTTTATPPATATATAAPSTSTKPSAPATTGTPSASPAAPAPSGPAGPVGKPSAKPVSAKPAPVLASTGGNSSQMIAYGAGGAALLAVGGGALVIARRRGSRG